MPTFDKEPLTKVGSKI